MRHQHRMHAVCMVNTCWSGRESCHLLLRLNNCNPQTELQKRRISTTASAMRQLCMRVQ
jgi:hypothetical protein